MERRRPRTTFARSGRGVHTGRPCLATVEPARFGEGLRVHRGALSWPVAAHAVWADHTGSTHLGSAHQGVGMVEHLLAALTLAGITDARIFVRGPEVPILDGTALPWWRALERAGLEAGPAHRPRPSRSVTVRTAGGIARWKPSSSNAVTVHVDFDGGPTGSVRHQLDDPPSLELLSARTFARSKDLPRLRAAGRGRGADPMNTSVFHPGDDPRAAVHHLLLDALGDRALGGPVCGHLEVWRPSHGLHAALWRAVAATGSARERLSSRSTGSAGARRG